MRNDPTDHADPVGTSHRHGEAGFAVVELVVVAVLVVAIGLVVWVSSGAIRREGEAVECRDELRETKVAVMDFTAIREEGPASVDELLTTRDPVRGGRFLDDRPRWYDVGAGGEITLLVGAPASCPEP